MNDPMKGKKSQHTVSHPSYSLPAVAWPLRPIDPNEPAEEADKWFAQIKSYPKPEPPPEEFKQWSNENVTAMLKDPELVKWLDLPARQRPPKSHLHPLTILNLENHLSDERWAKSGELWKLSRLLPDDDDADVPPNTNIKAVSK